MVVRFNSLHQNISAAIFEKMRGVPGSTPIDKQPFDLLNPSVHAPQDRVEGCAVIQIAAVLRDATQA